MYIDEIVNIHYSKLNETDIYIWKYINQNRKLCENINIEQLAENCNVSRTTISRFAKKLSLNGYSELKVHLKWQNNSKVDTDEDVLDMVCNDYYKVIDDMKKKDCSGICDTIYKGDRIFAYGSGSVQSAVAREMQRMFMSVGKPIIAMDGGAEVEILLNHVKKNDVVILISLSGESDVIVSLARQLHTKGIKTISITKLKKNELARLSSYNIYITTSFIDAGTVLEIETTTLFYIVAELLLIKYSIFINKFKKNYIE